jgi:Leucine-rich repeat (LRR) protein
MAHWFREHGHLISHLTVEVHTSEETLTLRDFTKAAAACRSIDLTISHFTHEQADLSDLDVMATSLHGLTCEPFMYWAEFTLTGTSVLHSLSRFTALHLVREDLRNEEPWGLLATLTSLQQLHVEVTASGDPSPISALTGLSSLKLQSFWFEAAGAAPFCFSSLQPLSALQQLEVLHLGDGACAATSLQGLAGLSSLKVLVLGAPNYGELVSLEGISPGVVDLSIADVRYLVSLAGLEACTSLKKLSLSTCGVSSLQALRALSSLKHLDVLECPLTSLEGLNNMSLQSLSLTACRSLTQLSGLEHLSAMKSLDLMQCGVTSLQPLSRLGERLQKLCVYGCETVREEVLELPHVQPTVDVKVGYSRVKEVVLAGKVAKSCPIEDEENDRNKLVVSRQ